MSASEITQQVRKMRDDWERRAQQNARYYVATDNQNWTDEEFFRSGEQTADQCVRNDLENICQGRDPRTMRALEIGCGAGRITRALAGIFGQVCAVDISPEMVRQARKAVRHLPNARVFLNNGKDLSVVRERWWHRFTGAPRPKFDFAFSCIVFQHIPSRYVIENYVREVNRSLNPGALFKFQVQGYQALAANPDDTWVGVSFTEDDAREMAERCGFEMRYHVGAGGQDYWLWLFKEREIGG